MRVPLLLLVAPLLAGCASTPAPASDRAAACEGGAGPVFLATSQGGGFVAPDYVPHLVEIAHNGTIRVLQGHMRGEGRGDIIEATPGAMHDLTLDDARAMLARRNITLGPARDLVVTRGDAAALPRALYATFCGHVVDALPKLARDAYPNAQGCVDQGSRAWGVSTTSGERHLVVDDCADANETAPFRALADELTMLEGPG